MKKMPHTLYTATLVDPEGRRHIVPSKASPALCGATGTQDYPCNHRMDTLCLRCRQKHMRQIAEERMTRFGL